MNATTRCRHLSNQDLYRTILLEEGCDLEAPRRLRPAPVSAGSRLTLYSTDAATWTPRLRVWFGESFAG